MNFKPIIVDTAYSLYQKEKGRITEAQAINQVCATLKCMIGYKTTKQEKEQMTEHLKEILKGF